MVKEEKDFINKLVSKLRATFEFKFFDILEGRGIIVIGTKY